MPDNNSNDLFAEMRTLTQLHRLTGGPAALTAGDALHVMYVLTKADLVWNRALSYDLADLTRRLVDVDWRSEDDLEDRLNHTFWGLEDALEGAFERKYAESPEDFDPVVADGVDRQPGSWAMSPISRAAPGGPMP